MNVKYRRPQTVQSRYKFSSKCAYIYVTPRTKYCKYNNAPKTCRPTICDGPRPSIKSPRFPSLASFMLDGIHGLKTMQTISSEHSRKPFTRLLYVQACIYNWSPHVPGADPGVVRVVQSNPLNWERQIFLLYFFLWKKDLLNNNKNEIMLEDVCPNHFSVHPGSAPAHARVSTRASTSKGIYGKPAGTKKNGSKKIS